MADSLDPWDDPVPPGVDSIDSPLRGSRDNQHRFNIKSLEVQASFGGASSAPGMMDSLCTKIEEMLQRHRKELLADIFKRDEMLFENVRNSTRVDRTTYGSEVNGTYTSDAEAMTPATSIRFSTQPQEVIHVATSKSRGEASTFDTSTIRESEATTRTSATGVSHVYPHMSLANIEADDEERKQQARQIDAKDDEVDYEDEELAEALAVVQGSWRRRMVKFVASSEFELTFAIFIVTNSVFIGVQVDWASRNPGKTNPLVFYVFQQMYAAVFLVELLIRLVAEGCHFFCSSQWYWNYLDLFLVLASIFEVITEMLAAVSTDKDASLQNVSNVRIIRIVRVARLMRIFRILRVVRFIRGLRTLLFSIMCTLKSLVWAMLLLLIIIYVFGIVFTQAVSDYLPSDPGLLEQESTLDQVVSGQVGSEQNHEEVLRAYYGSLTQSMYTLFEAVSGGLSWGVMTRPLNDVSLLCNIVFTIYVAFVYFAVLNVVTGVFCHAAIESAQADHDMVIQQQLANKQTYVKKVKQLFEDLDSDSSGTITLTEFESHFQDESVQAYFTSLDLDPKDAWTLFKLLDTNCTHQVDIEEFAMGCLRLRGAAKRIDIELLMYGQQRMLRGLSAFSSLVEHQLATIIGETMRLTNTAPPPRSSLLAARDALQELKDLASTGPVVRYDDLSTVPKKHKKKSSRKRISLTSSASSGPGSRKSSLGSSASQSSHVRWGIFASASTTEKPS